MGRGGERFRDVLVLVVGTALALAACGDDGGAFETGAGDDATGDADAGGGGAEISNEDVCALLGEDEIVDLLGEPLPFEPSDAGPYPSCSWRTGRLIVQVIPGSDHLVFAPGQECDDVEVGDEAAACPGAVQFLAHGMRARVSTIEDVTADELLEIARHLEPKLADL